MKKIVFSSLVILFVFMLMASVARAQANRPKENIAQSNMAFLRWFNAGKIDSIATLYHTNACIAGVGCGTESIKEYYRTESMRYKMQDLVTTEISVNGNLATETGSWKIILPSGMLMTGKYTSEWKREGNSWLIVQESAQPD